MKARNTSAVLSPSTPTVVVAVITCHEMRSCDSVSRHYERSPYERLRGPLGLSSCAIHYRKFVTVTRLPHTRFHFSLPRFLLQDVQALGFAVAAIRRVRPECLARYNPPAGQTSRPHSHRTAAAMGLTSLEDGRSDASSDILQHRSPTWAHVIRFSSTITTSDLTRSAEMRLPAGSLRF
jgi:hypothetical protein